MRSVFSFLVLAAVCIQCGTYNYSDINLHPDHLPYFLNMYKELASQCITDNCLLKVSEVQKFDICYF